MNEKLKSMVENIEVIRQLYDEECNITVIDSDGIILGYALPKGKERKESMRVGKKLVDPTGAFDKAIRTGRKVHNILPKEVTGTSVEGNLVPIEDDGKVVGCIIFTYSVEEKDKVKQIAGQFKESVNDINNSIHDIIDGTEKLADMLNDMNSMTADVEKAVSGADKVVNQ